MFEDLIWLVPAAVAVLGWFRPRAGLCLFAASLPLFGAPPGGPYLAAADVAAVAAVVTAWRAGAAGRSPLDLPVAGYALVGLASLFPLAYHPPSWSPRLLAELVAALPGVQSWSLLYTWRAVANLLLGVGLYVAVRRAFAGRSPRPLGLALGGGLAAALVVGFAGYAGWVDLGAYRPIGAPLYDDRFHSLFLHSGWLSQFAVVTAPFALGALVAAGRRAAAAGLGGLVAAALVLSQQRGSWITAVLLVGVLLAFGGRALLHQRRRLAPALLALLLASGVAAGVLLARPQAARSLAHRATQVDLSGRTHLWASALRLAEERPVLGWGLGSFAPAYDRLQRASEGSAWPFRATAHSLYLTVAAERGALGLLSLALLAAACLATVLATARRGSGRERPLAVGLGLSLVAVAVYGGVQYVFHLKNTEWLCWLLVGAVAALPGEAADRRWLRRPIVAVAALALLAVPVRLAVLTPLAGAGDREFGFNELEESDGRSLEWTEGRAVRRIPWNGSTLRVHLANGHPKAAERPVEVEVLAAGASAEATLGGGWRVVELEVGPPRAAWTLLEIRAEPTFRPFSDFRSHPALPPSRDIRRLGVAFGGVEWVGDAGGDRGARPGG